MARPQKTKKKEKKNVLQGVVHIQSTFNNTIVTSTDTQGNAVAWATAGATGFKGARKGTPFAAQSAAELVAKKSIDQGMKKVEVHEAMNAVGNTIFETCKTYLVQQGKFLIALEVLIGLCIAFYFWYLQGMELKSVLIILGWSILGILGFCSIY